MSKVSVVIPAYNVASYIKRCIDSVIDDPFVEEVIVVDDGSSDDTILTIKNNFGNHSKLVLLHHENNINKGACASRNLGLRAAKSDWVQFLDSDDLLLPGKFERQLKIAEDVNADLILGAYYYIDCNKKWFEKPERNDIWLGFIKNKLGHTNSNLWKKKPIMAIGGWADDWPSNQEYELLLRVLKANFKIGYDFTPSSEYIKRENSISTLGKNEGWQRQIVLRLEMGDYLYEIGELNQKRLLEIHVFLFNKLLMLRRVKSLKSEWETLNNRFLKSKWYNNMFIYRSSKRNLIYCLLGFELSELLLKMSQKIKNNY